MSADHAEHQKVLFEAIERGDVAAVREMLGADDLLEYDPWSSSPDINAPNDQDDTPFTVAVRKKDYGKNDNYKFLLEKCICYNSIIS